MSYQRLAPGFRMPWGHRHKVQEEVYVLLRGSIRAKLDDQIVGLRVWDALRVPAGMMRGFEAGPDGAELLAFGAPTARPAGADLELEQGWSSD